MTAAPAAQSRTGSECSRKQDFTCMRRHVDLLLPCKCYRGLRQVFARARERRAAVAATATSWTYDCPSASSDSRRKPHGCNLEAFELPTCFTKGRGLGHVLALLHPHTCVSPLSRLLFVIGFPCSYSTKLGQLFFNPLLSRCP